MKHPSLACLLCASLCSTTVAASAQAPVVTGSPAIADTVARLFTGIAEATSTLDIDRLMTYYDDSEALTYVARGEVTRSRVAFEDLVNAQLGGLSGATLRWLNRYVDVLSNEVAVVTATYELTVMLPDGGTAGTTGTYMCIFVRHGGRWQVRYSAHSFPPQQP